MAWVKRLYRSVYKNCPLGIQGWATKMVARLPGKPSVKPCMVPRDCRFPNPYRGALVFSADFEMAWAWRFAKSGQDPVAMGLLERSNVTRLLSLFDEYSIPVTWATVGHLFLDSCTRENRMAHENLPRIPHFTNRVWSFEEGDWYRHDPCTNLAKDPAWYASDLLDQIQKSKVGHEIGCHTFSHLDCTDDRCPETVMEGEISECIQLARQRGVVLRSMVFPGGTNGNYAVLKRHGFTNYRINSPWDLFYPEKDRFGLWQLPSTESVMNHGFGWSSRDYLRYYQRFMDKAIQTGTVCHLWFHPSLDQFGLEEILPGVLAYARKKADEGVLWSTTMGEMADFCEGGKISG